jgi:hypothetical protein
MRGVESQYFSTEEEEKKPVRIPDLRGTVTGSREARLQRAYCGQPVWDEAQPSGTTQGFG